MNEKTKNIICGIIVLVCAIFALTVPSWAKTIEAGVHTLTIRRESGATVVKWDDKVYNRYDFRGKVKVVRESRLTRKMLVTRKARNILYIEKIVGRVINDNLDGRTTCGNYISYQSLAGYAVKGDKVVTYCIYSPYTHWIDDIDSRFDAFI